MTKNWFSPRWLAGACLSLAAACAGAQALPTAPPEQLGLSAERLARVGDWLRTEVQHRHGVHRYRLSDFGLAERDVDRALEHYRETFRV